jgi:Arc/MetJ-type ribon-helix-helix transcriptional regulator
MGSAKVAITIREDLLDQIDRWVAEGRYPNRSQAIQAAVAEKLERARRRRLAEEAAKLDPKHEKALAEEGFAVGSKTWPEY